MSEGYASAFHPVRGGWAYDEMVQRPIPITEVFHGPETGHYGYRHRFERRPTHFTLDTCLKLEHALQACDPHHELVWEDASDADETKILTSRGYKPDSVLDRLSRA
jgi:hypothetical protein